MFFSGYIPVKELDQERARASGLALNVYGTRSGIFAKQWRKENEALVKEICSYARKCLGKKLKTQD